MAVPDRSAACTNPATFYPEGVTFCQLAFTFTGKIGDLGVIKCLFTSLVAEQPVRDGQQVGQPKGSPWDRPLSARIAASIALSSWPPQVSDDLVARTRQSRRLATL